MQVQFQNSILRRAILVLVVALCYTPAQSSAQLLLPLYGDGVFDPCCVPHMFADFMMPCGNVDATVQVEGMTMIGADVIGSRTKIAEHNHVIPRDRFYFVYDHFHNALMASQTAPPLTRHASLDRYTLGFEKTIFNDFLSFEMRIPFFGSPDLTLPPNFAQGFGPTTFSSGDFGNLLFVVKRSIYETDNRGVSVGVGVDAPTASDTSTTIANQNTITFSNDAVHLKPFIGMVGLEGRDWFYQGMLEVDIPLCGKEVTVTGATPMNGILTEQTLLHLDISAGCWIYSASPENLISGIAPVVELNYTTSLNDADMFTATSGFNTYGFSSFMPGDNRFDILNFTLGVNVELAGRTHARVGAVFPLRNGDRVYDTNVNASIIYTY